MEGGLVAGDAVAYDHVMLSRAPWSKILVKISLRVIEIHLVGQTLKQAPHRMHSLLSTPDRTHLVPLTGLLQHRRFRPV